jgi:hypothetical protein
MEILYQVNDQTALRAQDVGFGEDYPYSFLNLRATKIVSELLEISYTPYTGTGTPPGKLG